MTHNALTILDSVVHTVISDQQSLGMSGAE